MPKIEFDSGFKKKSPFDFNKLTLEQNERARICVIESPTVEYVHSLSAVVMENGRPIMKEENYGKHGEKTRQVPETRYLGKFICLGDFDVLQDKDVDPNNCPACKASQETSAIEGPKRRFGAHVIKYQVKKNSFTPQEPFQVELLVWDFTETRYNALTDIKMEHGALPGIDLNLGPCENKGFQKYNIVPGGGKAAWQANEKTRSIVQDVVKSQKIEDVAVVLGRRVSPAELRSQVAEAINAWNLAFGTPGEMPEEETQADAGTLDGFDIDFTSLTNDSSEASTEETPAAEETSTEEAVAGDTEETASEDEQSLEDLLGISFK